MSKEYSFNGQYRARVINTVHPEGLMMASVRVEALTKGVPDNDCPWAEYQLDIGGAFAPTIAGDLVWVDFPYGGDTRRPRIIGAAQDANSGQPNVPPESWGGGDAYQPPEVEGAPPLRELNTTKDYVSKRNGLLEVRTSGGGWSVTHIDSDTTLGMNESGQVYIITTQDVFVNAAKGVTVKSGIDIDVEAVSNITIKAGANITLEAMGDITMKAGGNVSIDAKEGTDITSKKATTIDSGTTTEVTSGVTTEITSEMNTDIKSGALFSSTSKLVTFNRI